MRHAEHAEVAAEKTFHAKPASRRQGGKRLPQTFPFAFFGVTAGMDRHPPHAWRAARGAHGTYITVRGSALPGVPRAGRITAHREMAA
jgi:hypothetical protein